MKLTCNQSTLNTHLSLVSRAVPSRPSHPILANIRLAAHDDDQIITLTGFDLALGIQSSFDAQIDVGGTLTLPAKLLGDIISRLPDGAITIESGDDDAMVTITSKSGTYQVNSQSADEYPDLPELDGDRITLPSEAFLAGLRGALFSASYDETKQVLTGVHVSVDGNALEFASTDGHRLSVVKTLAAGDDITPSASSQFSVTVPAKALREVEKLMQMQQGKDVSVRFDQGQITFDWHGQHLTSRLLEGQYPNYRQLIPNQFSRVLTVDRRTFIGALERVAVIADQRNSIIKLSLSPSTETVIISVDAQDVGNGREEVPAQISGDALDTAFNVKYLLEGLKVMSSNDIQMQFNSATSPSVVNPLGEMKMTYLVMPVQLRS